MITKDDLGISTASLYPMYTEEAFEALLEMGFRVFELFLNAQQEFSLPFLRKLKQRADEVGAIFTSVHPYTSPLETMMLFSGYDRRTEEGFDLYKGFMESAAYVGAKYVIIHGQYQANHIVNPNAAKTLRKDEKYWDIFGKLYHLGKKAGACPLQENVFSHKSQSVGFIRGMREYLGEDCGFVLDTKQCRLSGMAIEDMLDAMGNRLGHMHISDCLEKFPCILPGFGEYDFAYLFAELNKRGYQGKLVTEVYNSSYKDKNEIKESCLRMQKLF